MADRFYIICFAFCGWLAQRIFCCYFYCASICEGGLGSRNSLRLSIYLSVTRVHCDKIKWCTADILIPHEKGNHSATLVLRVVGGRRPFLWNRRSKWPKPFEKRRLRPISTHNVSTVGDTKKSSITTSHRWGAYVTPKCPKGWLKAIFFRFLVISQRVIVSGAVNLVSRWVS